MNFTHIPSAMWFEGKVGRDGGSALKLLATQKRKTFRIQDLVDQGVINRNDIHPVDIIANYMRRKGRDFATLDIVEAAVSDGLASKKPKEGFVQVPAYKAPILAKYHLHPLLADHIYQMSQVKSMGLIEKASVAVKMAAFHNPLFLPMYDTVQGVMLGSFRSIKTPKHLMGAIKDEWKKTPEYFEALDSGLASQPFNNPFNSYRQMIEGIKSSGGNPVATFITQNGQGEEDWPRP